MTYFRGFSSADSIEGAVQYCASGTTSDIRFCSAFVSSPVQVLATCSVNAWDYVYLTSLIGAGSQRSRLSCGKKYRGLSRDTFARTKHVHGFWYCPHQVRGMTRSAPRHCSVRNNLQSALRRKRNFDFVVLETSGEIVLLYAVAQGRNGC